jgi:uncharacterized membrane protein (DUF2068 family)
VSGKSRRPKIASLASSSFAVRFLAGWLHADGTGPAGHFKIRPSSRCYDRISSQFQQFEDQMTLKPSHRRGLQLIAAFKLLKAFALLILGIGALKLLHQDLAALIKHWISIFQVDPHNHFIYKLLEKVPHLDDRRLKELSVGTFIYAAIFFTEGLGLAFGKRWAEYFTIITTASFLPIEVYELFERASIGKSFALLINLAVVAYLVRELRRTRKPH